MDPTNAEPDPPPPCRFFPVLCCPLHVAGRLTQHKFPATYPRYPRDLKITQCVPMLSDYWAPTTPVLAPRVFRGHERRPKGTGCGTVKRVMGVGDPESSGTA